MKQSKFTLADLLTIFAAIVFGYICFLSIYYETLGNVISSFVRAVLIALLLSTFAMLAGIMKRAPKDLKRIEMIFLSLFTVFAAFSTYSFFPHIFIVSKNKTEIQDKLNASIDQAEKMYADYESYVENRKNLYEKELWSVVNGKDLNPGLYYEYGFKNDSDYTDFKQIEDKIFAIKADLLPSNYNENKQRNFTWLAGNRNSVENWGIFDLIKIVDLVNNLERNSKSWLDSLVKYSAVRQKGEQEKDFTYDLLSNDVKKYFTAPGKPTLLSIGIAILACIFMLLPYKLSHRRYKPPPPPTFRTIKIEEILDEQR